MSKEEGAKQRNIKESEHECPASTSGSISAPVDPINARKRTQGPELTDCERHSKESNQTQAYTDELPIGLASRVLASMTRYKTPEALFHTMQEMQERELMESRQQIGKADEKILELELKLQATRAESQELEVESQGLDAQLRESDAKLAEARAELQRIRELKREYKNEQE